MAAIAVPSWPAAFTNPITLRRRESPVLHRAAFFRSDAAAAVCPNGCTGAARSSFSGQLATRGAYGEPAARSLSFQGVTFGAVLLAGAASARRRHNRRAATGKRQQSWATTCTMLHAGAQHAPAAAPSSARAEAKNLRVVELEDQLQAAVEAEEYMEAARLRDELQLLTLDSEAAVLAANREFYEAFQARDIERMARLWHEGPHSCCVHPANSPVHGHEAVIDSWERVFRGGNVEQISCERPSVAIRNGVARVVCYEMINDAAHLVVNNLFEHTSDGWKIWYHQAGVVDPRFL